MFKYGTFKLIATLALKVYYRQLRLIGATNIPKSGGALLVSNHRNSFVDALLYICLCRRSIVVVAKASLKKSVLLRSVLWFVGAEVVHRVSDDISLAAARENNNVLARLSQRILNGEIICLFPEGVSHSDPAHREFKTGAARIIMKCWESNPEIPIICSALLYSQKEKFRSDVSVHIISSFSRDDLPDHARQVGSCTEFIEHQVIAVAPSFYSDSEFEISKWLASGFASQRSAKVQIAKDGDRNIHFYEILIRLSRSLNSMSKSKDPRSTVLLNKVNELKNELESHGLRFDELFISRSPCSALLFLIREFEVLILGIIESALALILYFIPIIILKRVVAHKDIDRDHIATNWIFIGTPVLLGWLCIICLLSIYFIGWINTSIGFCFLQFSSFIALRFYDRIQLVLRRVSMFCSLIVKSKVAIAYKNRLEELRSELISIEESL